MHPNKSSDWNYVDFNRLDPAPHERRVQSLRLVAEGVLYHQASPDQHLCLIS